MLAFLHTAQLHVETFGALAREIDDSVPLRHEVRAELLSMALTAGISSAAVRAAVDEVLHELASNGAEVIVCTCSTIGGLADMAVVAGCAVLRVDRPVAEHVVSNGRRILLVAALPTALQQTLALLRDVASEQHRSPEIVPTLCEQAWRRFEGGDMSGYLAEIAHRINLDAVAGDVVLLAQASMAPVAQLVERSDISILSSPRLGVQAAFAALRRRKR